MLYFITLPDRQAHILLTPELNHYCEDITSSQVPSMQVKGNKTNFCTTSSLKQPCGHRGNQNVSPSTPVFTLWPPESCTGLRIWFFTSQKTPGDVLAASASLHSHNKSSQICNINVRLTLCTHSPTVADDVESQVSVQVTPVHSRLGQLVFKLTRQLMMSQLCPAPHSGLRESWDSCSLASIVRPLSL